MKWKQRKIVSISLGQNKTHKCDHIDWRYRIVEPSFAVFWYEEVPTLFSVANRWVCIVPSHIDLLWNLLKPKRSDFFEIWFDWFICELFRVRPIEEVNVEIKWLRWWTPISMRFGARLKRNLLYKWSSNYKLMNEFIKVRWRALFAILISWKVAENFACVHKLRHFVQQRYFWTNVNKNLILLILNSQVNIYQGRTHCSTK